MTAVPFISFAKPKQARSPSDKPADFVSGRSAAQANACSTGLIGVPLYRTFVEERVPFTIEMLFTERATVIHKVTCHFSQLGRGDDIVATVEVPVKVDVKFVEHLDWKEEKIFTRSRLYFCKSTIMKMKTSYFYLDDNHVSIGDQVWTRK